MEDETENTTNVKDFAWAYTTKNPNEKYYHCAFCTQKCSGSINRFKHHLARTHKGIKPCPFVPSEIVKKCKDALDKLAELKKRRHALLSDLQEGSTTDSKNGSEFGVGSSKTVVKGHMDLQATLNSKWKKEERREVCRKIGRFFYSSGLAFKVSNDPCFVPMCEAISNYGPGFVPPTMHELKTWILKAEVEDISKIVEEHKMAWKQYGCSIVSDVWSDGHSTRLSNFLVNSRAGTWFLRSVDASDTIKNGELLYNYLSEVIDEVGQENVVQIITDNGLDYENVGKRLVDKYTHLYWTPCAAHCIDLMLEDIGKLKIHKSTLAKAKQVVKFIYSHTWVLNLMRSFTNNQELLRPAVTRFATSYLTLQSIFRHEQDLRNMFSSEKWHSSGWANKAEGVKAQSTVMFDQYFWGHVKYCIQSVVPLIDVLREVDSERKPAMGFLFELMTVAKERIAFNCGHNKKNYMPVWNKIDSRWKRELHKPLHAAGYYLNPQHRFAEKFSSHEDVKEGLYECMDRMLSYEDRLKADVQLDQYDHTRGEFGSRIAIDSRKLRSPADWWIRFGSKTPELTKFAVRVLSLTCSSSGRERNWSTFERIHSKKRIRLEQKKLYAMAYVMYNTRLHERSIRRKTEYIDPIAVEEIESDDKWITEKEDPIFANDSSWLDEENLFDVDVIQHIPPAIIDKESCSHPLATFDSNVSSGRQIKKRKTKSEASSRRSLRNERHDETLILIDENEVEDLEEIGGSQANEEDFTHTLHEVETTHCNTEMDAEVNSNDEDLSGDIL